MGIKKPRWKYLLQEVGDGFHIQLEDGNGCFDEKGNNGFILLEDSQQSIGCDPSPLLSVALMFILLWRFIHA